MVETYTPRGDNYSIGERSILQGVETLVTGFLALQIRLRSDLKGPVTIIEHRWAGTAPADSTEWTRFIVKVGERVVYRSPSEIAGGDLRGAAALTTVPDFAAWLGMGVA